eukprot:m51a1_g1132 putative beta-galactosidase (692) ;mRNA; r:216471-219371
MRVLAVWAWLAVALAASRSFVVEGDHFVKDGSTFTIVSGAFHYFRTPPALWADRLRKMRLGGLNTVETYVPWNLHEPVRGQYTFEGMLNITRFIEEADAAGLLVIVRPPPYICAEWEFGGFPAWLLEVDGIVLRQSNQKYYDALDPFLRLLIQTVAPYQYARGGPVIAVQVENEYGSYGSDHAYLDHLRGVQVAAGIDSAVLFSSNAATVKAITAGASTGVLKTVNFGTGENVKNAFKALRTCMPQGPLFCSEFWDGWFDAWGGAHETRTPEDAARTLDEILAAGASVNMYMYVGGTNFGLVNGANGNADKITPDTTSYDYDAPISEDGDVTPKWLAFRNVISKYVDVPTDPAPPPTQKTAYPSVALSLWASLMDTATLSAFSDPVKADRPLPFSKLGLDYGYVMYETTVGKAKEGISLKLSGVRDHAVVFVDGVYQGSVDRLSGSDTFTLPITSPRAEAVLRILVENQGRINFDFFPDDKGLMRGATIDGDTPSMWAMWKIPLQPAVPRGLPVAGSIPARSPAFYRGSFTIAGEPTDTFFQSSSWTKGIIWINGVNIGRFWPAKGPQVNLYIPAPLLRSGLNEVVVFEEDTPAPGLAVDFADRPGLVGSGTYAKACSSAPEQQWSFNETTSQIVLQGSDKCTTVTGGSEFATTSAIYEVYCQQTFATYAEGAGWEKARSDHESIRSLKGS